MAVEATADLLIGQWVDSPRLRASIDAILSAVREDVVTAFDRLTLMRHIDSAEGVWLDYLGVRVGIRRPAINDPTQDIRFGFDDAGVGFDQAPFRGVASNDAVFPLNDAVFRTFVKARGILVLGDGSFQTFARAVGLIDPAANVRDNRDMTVSIVTRIQPIFELADSIGALPRSGGVEVRYIDRERFGFDDAGVGFDQGPFTADS